MLLVDEIIARTEQLGLPTDLTDRQTVTIGNCITQFQVTESYAGRLVRQLEDHFRITDRNGPLGLRFKRIPA